MKLSIINRSYSWSCKDIVTTMLQITVRLKTNTLFWLVHVKFQTTSRSGQGG